MNETTNGKITKEKLITLFKIYDELDIWEEKTSEAIKTAKLNKDKTIYIKRKEEKESGMVSEGALWEEVRYLNTATEAFNVLKEKYPEAFNNSNEYQKRLNELTVFCHQELNIDPIKLRLRDIIQICLSIFDYKLKEQKNDINN
jgi:hypothetical protein